MATSQTGTSGSASGSSASMHASSSGMQTGIGSRGGQAVSDLAYDLISVMYHTLQGCQTYEKYAQDAEQAGHQDIAQFFRDTGQQFERCAERGRQLLAQCLQQEQGRMGQGGRSGQLSSQMGSSGQHGQPSGSQGQMGSSESGSKSSGSAGMGSSGSSSLGTGGSGVEGGKSGGTRGSGRGSGNR